jgi:hypothetical protein
MSNTTTDVLTAVIFARTAANTSACTNDEAIDPPRFTQDDAAQRAHRGQAFARPVVDPSLQLLHAGADLIIALRFALAGLGRGGRGCFRSQCGG